MYKGNYSNTFVKWAVVLFLFPVYTVGVILRGFDYLIKRIKENKMED